ncbi:MAG: ATP-binding protein [Desulfobacterales bacterium]|nr:ATP-binding protein [Desulfobacterales bacterium]
MFLKPLFGIPDKLLDKLVGRVYSGCGIRKYKFNPVKAGTLTGMNMNVEELKTLLEKLRRLPSETEWVEFKEAKSNFPFDDLGKYFSALSNEVNLKGLDFGWLVLGVSDQPPRKIVGTNYRPNRPALDKLKKEIADHTTSRLGFEEIYELYRPEGRVLMLQIPPALQGIPTSWKGHYYGREGESLVPLSLGKIERIRGQVLREDWSAKVCEDATLDDLEPEAIRFAKKQYKEKQSGHAQELDQWDDLTFLNKAKVCISGQLTNAALVLPGKGRVRTLPFPGNCAAILGTAKRSRHRKRL